MASGGELATEKVGSSFQRQGPSSLVDSQPAQGFKCRFCKRPIRTAQGLKSHVTRLHSVETAEEQFLATVDLPQPSVSSLKNHAAQSEFEEEVFVRKLSNWKSRTRILRRIPKGARIAVAEALADTIDICLRENTSEKWERLLIFAVMTLHVPKKGGGDGVSLATQVKKNVALFRQGGDLCTVLSSQTFKTGAANSCEDERRAKQAEAKVADGDVRGAIRILGSEASFAPFDEKTRKSLSDLHTDHDEPPSFTHNTDSAPPMFCFGEADVKDVIVSFPAGSSGGPDMIRPQHLKDMICFHTGLSGTRLLTSISRLCSVILEGRVPTGIDKIIFGANLCALEKKGGGIRPIAVGNVWRRISAKLCCRHIMASFGQILQPVQMGFGSKGGAEAVAHAARRFVNTDHDSAKVFLKLDFHNAFNSVRRDTLLQAAQVRFPELLPFLDQCYKQPTLLSFGSDVILSKRGIQQGDPMGPALFCAVMHPMISKLQSDLNVWYLDDGALGGEPEIVRNDVQRIILESRALGLELNPTKCELFCLSSSDRQTADIRDSFSVDIPGIRFPAKEECVLLGAPLRSEAISKTVNSKTDTLKIISKRLEGVKMHVAYFLLNNALAIPKLVYTLRSAPTWTCDNSLRAFDDTLRAAVEKVINVKLGNTSWSQVTLPINIGGLGLKSASALALPAFLSSVSSVADLVQKIWSGHGNFLVDEDVTQALVEWSQKSSLQLPPVLSRIYQSTWEAPLTEQARKTLLEGASSLQEKARLQGVASSESGAFLKTLPVASLGTLLDNNAFRIAVALRLGSPVCEPHVCVCGQVVDSSGLHGLRCKKTGGRRSRHEEVNDIIKRGLVSAGFPSIREPAFLSRRDNKRPDGVTLTPWQMGKSLVWDFTCVDALAPSYVERSADEPLYAASLAERNKRNKYADLSHSHHFCPVAAECLGSIGKDSLKVLRKIGKGIVKETGEKRASEFFLQRISVAVQRGNAAAILGTIQKDSDLEEIMSLF